MGYIEDNADGSSKRRWRLVEVAFATPLRLTDCDFGIEWNGNSWLPGGIEVGEIQSNPDGQSASFTAPDADGTIFPLLVATNGAEGLTCRIYLAEFAPDNESATPDDVVKIYEGRMDTATANNAQGRDEVIFQAGPAAIGTAEVPVRLISSLRRAV